MPSALEVVHVSSPPSRRANNAEPLPYVVVSVERLDTNSTCLYTVGSRQLDRPGRQSRSVIQYAHLQCFSLVGPVGGDACF